MNSESQIIVQAERQLRDLLAPLPMRVEQSIVEQAGVDLILRLGEGDRRWTLVCEVKSNGQARYIRAAALQARELAQRMSADERSYPVVVAPFISAASGEVCRDLGVGYADLAGNCRLAFGSVYIEKSVPNNPFRVKQEQRSLFAPKSVRVLRIMLAAPARGWKVAELAERAGVSYGQVSKVRKYLLDHEWATGNWGGVRISRPQALLEAWRQAYTPLQKTRTRYYTLLHGEALQRAIRDVFANVETTTAPDRRPGRRALLSSYSAARWLAPYARIAGEYFYADKVGEARLKARLKLEPAAKGENITIDLASDEGVFQESVEPAPGLFCTGLIQTYLDLAASGERGGEAAQHLFDERINPMWKAEA